MTITVQRPSSVGDVLAARAVASPGVRALVVGDDDVTYGELWDRAAHTARGLQRLGVGPGDLVGVLMPNCVDFVVLFHAVGLVGATVVPINIRYRRNELRYLVAHSRMKVLVTSDLISDHVDLLDLVADSFADLRGADAREPLHLTDAPDLRHVVLCGGRVARTDIAAVTIDDVRAAAADDPRESASFTQAAGPDEVLMVLYTSGTTAAPKGCQIPQRAVTENWTNWVDAIHLVEGDRIWLACPFFHIAGIGPAIGATIAGATALTDTHFDADAAVALIEREEPVHLFPAFPPITFGVLRHPAYDRSRFGFIRTLHNVAPPDTMRVVQQLLPDGAAVLNNFGMTESAGCVTYAGPDASEDVRIGTTGPALTGFDVRVADAETCAPLPAGERGEIQFRGPNTFRAYLHDPDGDGGHHPRRRLDPHRRSRRDGRRRQPGLHRTDQGDDEGRRGERRPHRGGGPPQHAPRGAARPGGRSPRRALRRGAGGVRRAGRRAGRQRPTSSLRSAVASWPRSRCRARSASSPSGRCRPPRSRSGCCANSSTPNADPGCRAVTAGRAAAPGRAGGRAPAGRPRRSRRAADGCRVGQ